MKVVDVAVKKVYRFNCPNCQSRLEAETQDWRISAARFANSDAQFVNGIDT